MKATENNAGHTADAHKSNVEQKSMKNEISKVGLYFRDVTLSDPGVGECFALVGFLDQREAAEFAKLTDGEFAMFFKKDGCDFLLYGGPASMTDIYTLAGSCHHIVYIDDEDENFYYTVIDNINGSIVGEYDYKYPAYYEAGENKLYIFGVLYPKDRKEEIKELIE